MCELRLVRVVCPNVYFCVCVRWDVTGGHESRSGDNSPEKPGRDEGMEGQWSRKREKKK